MLAVVPSAAIRPISWHSVSAAACAAELDLEAPNPIQYVAPAMGRNRRAVPLQLDCSGARNGLIASRPVAAAPLQTAEITPAESSWGTTEARGI